jgi:cytochrome c553|tara:strand:+ start:3374 stop:3808 length:435 start_codon:yes stop_codon:yes gene_type:complete
MKLYILAIVVTMFSLITWTYQNLEYKGYKRVQGCTGECYEEYVRIHGSVVEQLQAKQEEAAADPFSSIRGLWAGCAACHGQNGQGMGAFPKLAGSDAEYISQRLYAYKNRETIGNMSSTMWAQAGMLSDNDIETLSKFIEETME